MFDLKFWTILVPSKSYISLTAKYLFYSKLYLKKCKHSKIPVRTKAQLLM